MKKISIIVLSVLLTGTMYAEDFNITKGWQLLGTGIGFNSTEVFNNSCIDTVWTYDKGIKSWKVYSSNTNTMNIIKNNIFINKLVDIDKNDGFWVNANSDCVISNDSIYSNSSIPTMQSCSNIDYLNKNSNFKETLDLSTVTNEKTITKGVLTNSTLEAGKVKYFKIEIGNISILEISSSGNTDVNIEIYDSFGNLVSKDDDSGNGYNFYLKGKVDKGIYYAKVTGYSPITSGSFGIYYDTFNLLSVKSNYLKNPSYNEVLNQSFDWNFNLPIDTKSTFGTASEELIPTSEQITSKLNLFGWNIGSVNMSGNLTDYGISNLKTSLSDDRKNLTISFDQKNVYKYFKKISLDNIYAKNVPCYTDVKEEYYGGFKITTVNENFNSGSLSNKNQEVKFMFSHPLDINKTFGCDKTSTSCDEEDEISAEILNNFGMGEGYSSEYKTLDSFSDISDAKATLSNGNKDITISWISSQTVNSNTMLKYFSNETLSLEDTNMVYSSLDSNSLPLGVKPIN